MIQFAAWTGVRAGELHAVQWDDVDGDYLWVRRSRKTDGSIGSPKNGRERRIAFLAACPGPRRRASSTRSVPVSHSSRGAAAERESPLLLAIGPSGIRNPAGARRGRAAADIRWHDLRHFCATQLLEMGLDHFAVSVQLGHEDGGALVMSRYGHPSKEAARERLLAAFRLSSIETGS